MGRLRGLSVRWWRYHQINVISYLERSFNGSCSRGWLSERSAGILGEMIVRGGVKCLKIKEFSVCKGNGQFRATPTVEGFAY